MLFFLVTVSIHIEERVVTKTLKIASFLAIQAKTTNTIYASISQFHIRAMIIVLSLQVITLISKIKIKPNCIILTGWCVGQQKRNIEKLK